MSDGFKVAKDLTLPREMLQWAIGFVGKRNSGKSYNAGDLCEEIIGQQIPLLLWDVMGIWWGLRIGVDKEGKPVPGKEGLPVVVIGGRHADIKLESRNMEKIVEALIQTNTSAVFDVSQFRKGQQIELATIFAETVYRLADLYPAERVVMVEEVDQVAPQRPFREEARCLGAFEDLVKLGGNRNICFIGITQRPASENKNVFTQNDMLVIGRLTAPQDKAAIQAWVEKHAEKDSKELEAWYDSLSGLKKGEVWVWNDDEDHPLFQKTKFRLRRTFHATRSFILSKEAADLQLGDATKFIEKFRGKFETTAKLEAKELKTVQECKAEIQRLKVELRSKPKSKVDEKELERQARVSHQRGFKEASAQASESLRKAQAWIRVLTLRLNKVAEAIGDTTKLETPDIKFNVEMPKRLEPPTPQPQPISHQRGEPPTPQPVEIDDVKFGNCEKMILAFLKLRPDEYFSKIQIGALTGYSATSGGFGSALSNLRKASLILQRGSNYSLNSDEAQTIDELTNGIELQNPEAWLNSKLLTDQARNIYKYLRENPAEHFTKEQLAEATRYSVTSGGFGSAISNLLTLGLAERNDGNIGLADWVQ